jgi:hypothetical protein
MTPKWRRQHVDRHEFLGVGGPVLGGLGSAAGTEPALLPTGVKAVGDLDRRPAGTLCTRLSARCRFVQPAGLLQGGQRGPSSPGRSWAVAKFTGSCPRRKTRAAAPTSATHPAWMCRVPPSHKPTTGVSFVS